MNDQLFRYVEYANASDRLIKSTELTKSVVVEHSDGSFFHFNEALLEEKDDMIIVYSDHNQPMVFFKEDILKTEYTEHRISSCDT